MANKKQSTAELIGISHFSRNGLMTKRYGEVVYFIVQPTNISVLSETSIAIKINHLMQLLSEQPDIEIICSDARENFEYNKLSLARKAEKEENLKVQLLLRRDMKFLDDIQLQMSTAREFMFAYGKLVDGVDVCKFGKQWVVSMDAMQREYGNRQERL